MICRDREVSAMNTRLAITPMLAIYSSRALATAMRHRERQHTPSQLNLLVCAKGKKR
jgi:hypothetical protein